MFFHYATHKISLICKISTFSEDLNFLNPSSHLKENSTSNVVRSPIQPKKQDNRKSSGMGVRDDRERGLDRIFKKRRSR